jgi:hypothetical protein
MVLPEIEFKESLSYYLIFLFSEQIIKRFLSILILFYSIRLFLILYLILILILIAFTADYHASFLIKSIDILLLISF